MDRPKSFIQQKMEERMIEVEEARRKGANSNGSPPSQAASTSLPTTGTGDKIKPRHPSVIKPAGNKPLIGGAGRVSKSTGVKEKDVGANDRKKKTEQAKRLAQISPLVAAGAVPVEDQTEVQSQFLRRKSSSSPPNDSNTSNKGHPPVNDASANGPPSLQVAGHKRPAPDNNHKDDMEVSNSKRLKSSGSHQPPTSTCQTRDEKKYVRKPPYKGTARPRSVAPTVKQGEHQHQQQAGPNVSATFPSQHASSTDGDREASEKRGMRLRMKNGRAQRVIMDSDDEYEESSPAKRKRPVIESTPVDIHGNVVQDPVHKKDIVKEDNAQKNDPALAGKRNQSKRKRDEENDIQGAQPKPLKIQKFQSEPNKENQGMERPTLPKDHTYLQLMEWATLVQPEKEEQARRLGTIHHKPTRRPVFQSKSTNARWSVARIAAPTTPDRSKAGGGDGVRSLHDQFPELRTDQQYAKLEKIAQQARKDLDKLLKQEYKTDPATRKVERVDKIGLKPAQKVAITRKENDLKGIVWAFEDETENRKAAVKYLERWGRKC